jgi:hypothetical protein
MSFQTKLNRDLPRGVAGDFASTNPRNSILAGEAALVAAEPITVGQFAFADLTTGKVYASFVAGRVIGFVHRNNQAVVALGQAASMTIPTGKEVALFSAGDFYAVAPAVVAPGAKVYALDADGAVDEAAATAQETNFVFAEAAQAGALVKITRFSI